MNVVIVLELATYWSLKRQGKGVVSGIWKRGCNREGSLTRDVAFRETDEVNMWWHKREGS